MCPWVFVGAFSAEPKSGIFGQNSGGFVHQLVFLRKLIFKLWAILVAPFDGPFVVIVYARKQSALADVVFGLGHIVKSCIVHDGCRVAMFLYPCLVAQLFNRRCIACAHVMAQSEGVTNLVRRDETYQFAHQPVVEVHRASTFVERSALCHVPFGEQIHHVMEPTDVTFDDFTAAWVFYMWAVSILGLRGKIAQHVETGIVKTHRGVVGGPLLALNGILKACRLEGNIPVVDSFNKVRHPFLGRCGVDIKHDWLDGFYQFTALIAFYVFGNEPETRDKLFALALVLLVREDGVGIGKETNAVVPNALAHGYFGQFNDRCVECKCYCARARGPYGARRCGISARCKHFYVDGIGLNGVDKCTIGLLSANLSLLEKGAVDANNVVVASKKARYIEEVHAFLGVSRHDGKGCNNGVGSALFQ